MKFSVLFKTPDVLDQILDPEMSDEEVDKMEAFIKKWVSFSETIRVEFDMEAETATVLEAR
jgi:hypothetical protein